jgi:tRNA threonylcarbamoyladenosine biosynthesis protein TsaB
LRAWSARFSGPLFSELMATFAQLLATHGCILAVDAASTSVQVGLLRTEQPPLWRSSPDEAGKALFALTVDALRTTGLALADVRAFVFDAGPGSMLGVRTAAMALRTWQALAPRPAYQFQGLTLLACELARSGQTGAVIADARRDTWHVVEFTAPDKVSPLRRVPSAELATTAYPLWQPAAFRAWGRPPRSTQDCAFELAALFAAHADVDLFTVTDTPDAFQHEAPEYKKWSAQVHSAATVHPK